MLHETKHICNGRSTFIFYSGFKLLKKYFVVIKLNKLCIHTNFWDSRTKVILLLQQIWAILVTQLSLEISDKWSQRFQF